MELEATAALSAGSLLWFLALRKTPSAKYGRRRDPEYWWAIAAFFLPGLGMLVAFVWPDVDSAWNIRLRTWPLVAVSMWLVGKTLIRRPVVPIAYLPLLVFLVVLSTIGLMTGAVEMALVSFVLFAPVLLVPSAGHYWPSLAKGCIDATKTYLIILVVFAVLPGNNLLGDCRFDKCSIWGLSIGGAFDGNSTGLLLAFMAGLTGVLTSNLRKLLMLGSGSFILVDLTAGRSAIISWGIAMCVIFFERATRNRLRGLMWLPSAALLVVVFIVALYPWREEAFTGRANLWERSWDLFRDSPLWGHGSSFWVRQDQTSDLIANYSTHNIATELAVSGGFIGLAAVVVALVAILLRNNHGAWRITAVITAVWLSGSITEVISAPGRLYLVPGVLILIFMTAHSSRSTIIR